MHCSSACKHIEKWTELRPCPSSALIYLFFICETFGVSPLWVINLLFYLVLHGHSGVNICVFELGFGSCRCPLGICSSASHRLSPEYRKGAAGVLAVVFPPRWDRGVPAAPWTGPGLGREQGPPEAPHLGVFHGVGLGCVHSREPLTLLLAVLSSQFFPQVLQCSPAYSSQAKEESLCIQVSAFRIWHHEL